MDQKINEANEPKILVCTVGTSTPPLITTINEHKPDYVIYIATDQTREKIAEIQQAVSWKGVKDSEIVMASNAEDINTCVREMREGIRKYLKLKKISPDVRIYADFTGGTKVMSAAVALVMMEYNSLFSYIGGTQRNPDDRLVVVDGKEKFILMDNPWDSLGIREARMLADAFNASQFEAALEQAKFLQGKRREGEKRFYEGLALVMEGFAAWDIFEYKIAKRRIDSGMEILKGFNTSKYSAFQPLYRNLENCQKTLEKIEAEDEVLLKDKQIPDDDPDFGRPHLEDLVANARRRSQAGHYDDAVARLYSAIEKTAKLALAKLGKNNSKMSMKDLEEGGDYFVEKYSSQLGEKKFAEIPLMDSWSYLAAIAPDNPAVNAWRENEGAMKKLQSARNYSLLAHGFKPISKDAYESLFELCLGVLGIDEDKLIKFPRLTREEIHI